VYMSTRVMWSWGLRPMAAGSWRRGSKALRRPARAAEAARGAPGCNQPPGPAASCSGPHKPAPQAPERCLLLIRRRAEPPSPEASLRDPRQKTVRGIPQESRIHGARRRRQPKKEPRRPCWLRGRKAY